MVSSFQIQKEPCTYVHTYVVMVMVERSIDTGV